jgi:hypothetical protein
MYKSEKDKLVHQAIVTSLKRELMRASWWNEVQEDVKTRLDWSVDHVEEIGSLFAKTFMSLFRWEYERRKLDGKDATSPMASYFSTLMGMRISEEAYQCGILPTRAILDLYDYVDPNDADVAACLMYCHKVEILEKSGILISVENELKTSMSEMAKVLRKEKPTRPKKIQEDTITWEDWEDSEDETTGNN